MKKYHLLILAAIAIFSTSCNKDENENNNVPGEPAVATFTITTPKTYVTTEAGSDAENTVSVLEFYIFDENGNRDAVREGINYGYHKEDLSSSPATPNNPLNPISFLVESGSNKKVLVAINLDLGELAGQDFESVEKKIIEDSSKLTEDNSKSVPTQGDQTKGLGMSGKNLSIEVIADKLNNEITIPVNRLVSKIEAPKAENVIVNLRNNDIESLFGNTLDADNDKITFQLEAYAVINGLEKSQVFTHDNGVDKTEIAGWNHWDRTDYWLPTKGYQRSVFDPVAAGGKIISAYSGKEEGSYWLKTASVYVYENKPLPRTAQNGLPGYDRETVYAYLIKGTLTHADDAANPVTRYWRVNLIPEDAFLIFRNTVYKVTLEEVMSKGYGTPKEAKEDEDGGEDGGEVIPGSGESGIKAEIQIVPWQIKTSGVKF
ncbi:MAG: hypothetical protein LIP01_11105 [Tannerellaceae bacterium]|nr:hypothetical protein [Tannerellaceae bacterium]